MSSSGKRIRNVQPAESIEPWTTGLSHTQIRINKTQISVTHTQIMSLWHWIVYGIHIYLFLRQQS